jgi:hypothetical protein
MNRIRTALTALVLGTALALPGLQLAQSVAPQAAHASSARLVGPVLAGSWLNLTPGARFYELQVQGITHSAIGAVLPTSITYGVNVYSITAHRFVAFGVSAPVPFTKASPAVVPLTAIPLPSLLFKTILTLSLINANTLRVDIRDHSPLLPSDRFSVEYMHR